MEIFTVDRSYKSADLIDDFVSVIWTERYYGDSEVELVLPMREDTLERVPIGVLIGCSKSEELMMLEEGEISEGLIKYKGISILSWLNNRFVRYSDVQSNTKLPDIFDTSLTPAEVMWSIVRDGATVESPLLNDTTSAAYGIPVGYGDRLKIPGLGLRDLELIVVTPISFSGDYGPVYDLVRKLATTYQLGCKIDWVPDADPPLGFRVYRGVDRTSEQSSNPVVRFSPKLDSLTDIKELFSKTNYKNLAFAYSTNAPLDYKTPGIAMTEEASESSGFDVRVSQVFVDNIPDLPYTYDYIHQVLIGDAQAHLGSNRYSRVIDGQIIPGPQFKYRQDYNMGDLVEEQGNTGAVSIGRVIEYIRSQDQYGEREYPTVGELESLNTNIV